MEHRCGTRVPMSMRTRLELPSKVLIGQIANLSLSGAFVAVPECIPDQTKLLVTVSVRGGFGSKRRWRVPAHVVRGSDAGVAVEWDTFAPWPILSLLRREAFGAPRSSSRDSPRRVTQRLEMSDA